MTARRVVKPKAHKRNKKKLTFVSLIHGELCCTQVSFGWGTTIPDYTWVSSFEADSVPLGLGGRRAPKKQRRALCDCAWEPTCSQEMGRSVLRFEQSAKDDLARSQLAAERSPTQKHAATYLYLL